VDELEAVGEPEVREASLIGFTMFGIWASQRSRRDVAPAEQRVRLESSACTA
jgi:hypothetical protein